MCWLAATLLCMGSIGAMQPAAQQPPRVRMTLVGKMTAAAPGTTVEVAVVFEIDPGWHLYWNGRNDTGVAPRVTWDAPEGVTVGPMRWPAPKRHVAPGKLLDHVYEDRLVLVAPVTIPADAHAGQSVTLKASAQWAVCADICILGDGEAGLTIPINESGGWPTTSAPIFKAVRLRQPMAPVPGQVTVARRDGVVEITVHGAAGLVLYPAKNCVPFLDLLEDGEAAANTLSLRLDTSRMDTRHGVLAGVLEVTRPGERPLFLRVHAPVDG